jgi:hypothetical protein
MSLALVGKYHNVRAPGEPGVRYVKHFGGGGIVVSWYRGIVVSWYMVGGGTLLVGVLVFELPDQMMKIQNSDDHHSWVLH